MDTIVDCRGAAQPPPEGAATSDSGHAAQSKGRQWRRRRRRRKAADWAGPAIGKPERKSDRTTGRHQDESTGRRAAEWTQMRPAAARSGRHFWRGSKLGYVIMFGVALAILATITLANTTTSAPGGAPGASPAGRATDDKTNDDYQRHHVQSTLQQAGRQQQGPPRHPEIPFKTPLSPAAPAANSTPAAERQLAKRAPEAATGATNSNSGNNNNNNNNIINGGGGGGRVAQHPLAQQQSQQHFQFLQQLRISETDLLPFGDFNVQQPAFSDIMKSWPPTTRQRQQQQQQHNDNDNYAGPKRQRAHPRPGHPTHQSSDDAPDRGQIRNHLNEDYDDTIVTADESFDQDQLPEPPTWVNYLGELGDLIYSQLSQLAAAAADAQQQPPQPQPQPPGRGAGAGAAGQARQQRAEIVEDLLDDFYYDQYENSQVLYYGPQLVHQGDIAEIGCYLPNEQPAEWTKSGRVIGPAGERGATSTIISPLRVVKRADFMGAKQNYSLKVFEAQLSDSGNYRCNRLSRKYHKLIVVPQKISLNQQFLYQQRLLSLAGHTWGQPEPQQQLPAQSQHRPSAAVIRQQEPALSQQQVQLAALYQTNMLLAAAGGQQAVGQLAQGRARGRPTIQASGSSGGGGDAEAARPQNASRAGPTHFRFALASGQQLAPGQLIHEHQPLAVQCHIGDEAVLRKLHEMPHFQLAWYKNGRLLRGSQPAAVSPGRPQPAGVRPGGGGAGPQQQQQLQARAGQRVQFGGPNGRQMLIHSANYADAGDYLCSWARLNEMLLRQPDEPATGDDAQGDSPADYSSVARDPPAASLLPANPASAAGHHQLVAPVKLRPFKSAYYVRAGNQLRLVCQVQRGFPAAHISWYVGNQLVDGDFLRDHPGEFRVLSLAAAQNRSAGGAAAATEAAAEAEPAASQAAKIVEINPIPAGRQQMQLTANGRGQWVEYRDLARDKYSIETPDRQLRYLQMKLAQLTGAGSALQAAQAAEPAGQPPQQASLSVLVVERLERERHTSRYACRATGRANTDEVTTVIRVKDSETIVVRPGNKAATLIPGQPLHFECSQLGKENAQFLWFKKSLDAGDSTPLLLEPNQDDNMEIHNERLTLLKPNRQSAGDYICQVRDDPNEFETIQVRPAIQVKEFGVKTSHTGNSATLIDGERLELNCEVKDSSVPVNITWLMSNTPDSDYSMVAVPEYSSGQLPTGPYKQAASTIDSLGVHTYIMPNNVMVERISNFSRKLIVRQLGPEHRGYYTCLVDNSVNERARKTIYIRVKDKILPLWPFLGILAELFILFTIIYVWETQRAQKSITTNPKAALRSSVPPTPGSTGGKRPASGPSSAFESVPLNG